MEKGMSYRYNTSEIITIVVIAYIVSYNTMHLLFYLPLDCRQWLSLEFIFWVVCDELFINFQAFLVIHAMLEPKLISTKNQNSFLVSSIFCNCSFQIWDFHWFLRSPILSSYHIAIFFLATHMLWSLPLLLRPYRWPPSSAALPIGWIHHLY